MGLAGLALQAGSKSAIGSLWYVDDLATSAFFSQFYRYLSRGVSKSTALTWTQRDFASGKIKLKAQMLFLELVMSSCRVCLHLKNTIIQATFDIHSFGLDLFSLVRPGNSRLLKLERHF